MTKKIVLGGGCFWGLQDLLRKQAGIIKTTVGYSGREGLTEVVEVEYDPSKTSFKKLLDFFFRVHDPTTLNRQGNDIGLSYRSVIFYANEQEKEDAVDFVKIVNNSKRWSKPVVTSIEPLTKFTEAEEYHQDYLVKNPTGYTCHVIRFDSYLG